MESKVITNSQESNTTKEKFLTCITSEKYLSNGEWEISRKIEV